MVPATTPINSSPLFVGVPDVTEGVVLLPVALAVAAESSGVDVAAPVI